MKYLKKFNEELKSSTYKSAADKLKDRHVSRANVLTDFGNKRYIEEENEKDRIRKEEDLKKWKEDIKKYSPFGIFNFTIKPLKPQNGKAITQGYYLKVTHWYENGFYDTDEGRTWLNMDIFLVPTDTECNDNISELSFDWKDGYNLHIYRGYINIKLNTNTCEVEGFVTDTADNFDGYIEISDRKTAVKYKRLISNIFKNRDYPNENDSEYPSLYNKFEATLAESGISSDYGLEMKNISDSVDKISINDLYRS